MKYIFLTPGDGWWEILKKHLPSLLQDSDYGDLQVIGLFRGLADQGTVFELPEARILFPPSLPAMIRVKGE